MARTKQYLMSPSGLQNAASTDTDVQPSPTLVPTPGEQSAKFLAKQSANLLPVQVGKDVDNTIAGQKERRRVEALGKRRDAQWVGEAAQASSAGGGALAKPELRKSTLDNAHTHKVYKKGRLPALKKTWLENPSAFTDPFDAFVVVITKQPSVMYYTAVIDTVKREEKSGIAEDAINWQIALDLKDVQVVRFAKMYKVPTKDIWPPMQSATHVATWGKERGGLPFEVGWPPGPPL